MENQPAHHDGPPPEHLARQLMASAEKATLATLWRDHAETPFASLALVADKGEGTPLMFLSGLSQHGRNLAANPRISLLIDGTAGTTDPLNAPRLTLIGVVAPTTDPNDKSTFLARHASAALYADFPDFRLYRVNLTHIYLVAGFGRQIWIEPPNYSSIGI